MGAVEPGGQARLNAQAATSYFFSKHIRLAFVQSGRSKQRHYGNGNMPTSIATIEIDGPASEVYRFLTSPRLLSEWISGLLAHRPLGGDGELRLGARSWNGAAEARKGAEVQSEIVGFEPDRSLNIRIESKGFHVLTDFHLFESDGHTTVRQSVQVSYKRWYRMFAPITNRMVQRKIDADLKRLKRRVEASVARKASRRAA